jgi:hypothetical protein
MKRLTFVLAVSMSCAFCWAQGLTSGGFTSSGAFQLQIQGGPLQVEYSTNLTTWQPDASARGTIIDAGSTNSEWRFYRARSGDKFAPNVIGFVRVPVEPGRMAVVASPSIRPCG